VFAVHGYELNADQKKVARDLESCHLTIMAPTTAELLELQRQCIKAKQEWESIPVGNPIKKQKYSEMEKVIQTYNAASKSYHQSIKENSLESSSKIIYCFGSFDDHALQLTRKLLISMNNEQQRHQALLSCPVAFSPRARNLVRLFVNDFHFPYLTSQLI
jgi:hypothetical protein